MPLPLERTRVQLKELQAQIAGLEEEGRRLWEEGTVEAYERAGEVGAQQRRLEDELQRLQRSQAERRADGVVEQT